jgi:multicomponent Na+:H+ antiporter subunit D
LETAVIHSIKPLLAVGVSLTAALLIYITGERRRNLRESWTILASVIKFTIIASMIPSVLEGKVLEYAVIYVSPGLSLRFRVDALGTFFAVTASFLWIITSFYSIGYVRSMKEHAQTRYFACFALALSATTGVAFSANLFTTFLFYEIITISTFPLVAHKETPEAMKGARRYVTYLLGTSIAFQLFAILMTYSAAGTLEYSYQGIFNGIRGGVVSDTFLIIVFLLFIYGIAKAAMIPFHSWLPAAMVAPTPVSALLHAVAVVKTGVFFMVKIVIHVFGIKVLSDMGLGTILACFASFTVIVASVIALRQDNLKAMLAYSTVSQLSYVTLGAALLSPSGIIGSVMHIVLHAFGKITLFFSAGAIYVATRKTRVSELDGIGRRMPFTMAAFTIAVLSMIGIPPAGGFISKWYIALGSVESEQLPVLVVLGGSTLLSACYFLPIVHRAFFKEAPAVSDKYPSSVTSGPSIKEAPTLMVAPLVLTALGVVALFFKPALFNDLARMVAVTVTGGN